MLVGDLKEGMIVTPQKGWRIDHVLNWPYYRKSSSKEEKKKGPWTEISPTRWTGPKGITVRYHLKRWDTGKDYLMYIGHKIDDFQWAGVSKHHRFLWNGEPVIMSGYDIKWLNIAEGFEHE